MNCLLSGANFEIDFLVVYIAYLIIISIATFFMYGADKFQAKRKGSRVPEKLLLFFSIIGGAFGGIIGMKVFRHKTKGEHWYFTAVNVLGIIVHGALIILLAFVF